MILSEENRFMNHQSDLSAPLLDWYDRCARVMPWRGIQDPYRTWVSESMLQQTRVETVLSYYDRFLRRFRQNRPIDSRGNHRGRRCRTQDTPRPDR